MDRERIIHDVRAYLTNELHIDLKSTPIKVALEENAIVMEGEVENISLKKRTVLAAMAEPGITGVIDRLMVRPSRTMTDKEIADHLNDALSEESAIDCSAITVEVNDGIIDLEGVVPSLTHKRLTGVLAWWIPGSRDVINSLDVQPPEEDTDDEVTDAVRTALEKDRLVDASAIRVATKEYLVTLSGTARDDIAREAAENDAWYVWGVNTVINEIEVIR
ncbi:MAG: BON domain-containing protein [Thermodesulfobacteriota bacterium]